MIKQNFVWHEVAKLSSLDAEEPTQVRIEKMLIALCLDGEEVFAMHDICSHEFACLSDGVIEDGCVECPRHRALFDIRTGKAMSAPATEDVRIREEKARMEKVGVKYILSCWVDLLGQPKTKPVPISDFELLCMGKGPQFAVHSISFVPELGPADADQIPLPYLIWTH